MPDAGARLRDRVAVVIGGAGGFGSATVHRFRDEGATSVVAGRDLAAARTAAERVEGTAAACDITVEADAANAMAGRGGGSIISSLTAHAPALGLAASAGSRAGLEYATRIAAVEYGAAGVRVNCVAPHLIDTPMTAPIFENRLAIEAVRRQTPLGRMGHVGDVANAVLFLAGDESGYITGQTICVDGGASSQKLPSLDDCALIAAQRPDLLAPIADGNGTEPDKGE